MPNDNDRIGTFLRETCVGDESAIEVLEAFGKEGVKKIVFTRERPTLPTLERSKARMHVLHTPEDVVTYVQSYGTARTVIMLNGLLRCGNVVLDEDAGGGREILSFRPVFHPLFVAWRAVLETSPHPISAFAITILKLRSSIAEPSNETLADVFGQITVSKETTVWSGVGKRSVNGVQVMIDIKGGKNQPSDVEIPDQIAVDCPLFIGRPSTTLRLDLTLDASGAGPPVMHVTAPTLEADIHDEFEEMGAEIGQAFAKSDGVVVVRGSAAYAEWPTVG